MWVFGEWLHGMLHLMVYRIVELCNWVNEGIICMVIEIIQWVKLLRIFVLDGNKIYRFYFNLGFLMSRWHALFNFLFVFFFRIIGKPTCNIYLVIFFVLPIIDVHITLFSSFFPLFIVIIFIRFIKQTLTNNILYIL